MAKPKPPTELSDDIAEAPGMLPPPGVEADVATTIKYRRRVDPASLPEHHSDDLRDLEALAGEESNALDPPDPLAEFLEVWANFAGYNCEIVRLPDPAARRMPGSQYARPCFELERLGGVPFDPVNFVPTLQMVNGYSGGAFRCWLTDANGQRVIGAILDRLVIADPPKGSAGNRADRYGDRGDLRDGADVRTAQPAPPKTVEPSEFERQMQDLQRRLLQNALDKALNPPEPARAETPPQMPDEDRLALMLFKQGDLLAPVIQKVVNAVQSPVDASAPTWKDKAMDYIIQNPVVGNQIASVGERLVLAITNLIPGLNIPPPSQQSQPSTPPPTQHAPHKTPAAHAQASNLPPEAPQPIDGDDENDEDMAILDELLALLNSARPLERNDPVFVDLQREHPIKFAFYMRAIATNDPDSIIAVISQASPFYASLLEGPASGPYLRKRLLELQALCRAPAQPQTAPPPATQETDTTKE